MKVTVISKKDSVRDRFVVTVKDNKGQVLYEAAFAYPTDEPIHTDRVSKAYVKMFKYEFGQRGWEVADMI